MRSVQGSPMPLLLQFISYSFAGAIGTAVHFLVLLVCVQVFMFHAVVASIEGSIAGAIVNYLLSYHWVFRSNRRHAEAVTKFLIVAGAGVAINAAIMYLMVTLARIHYLPSQVAATGIVLLWNFSGNRLWTFADEPDN